MNVRELIAELKKHPGEAKVAMRVDADITTEGDGGKRWVYAAVSEIKRNGERVTIS